MMHDFAFVWLSAEAQSSDINLRHLEGWRRCRPTVWRRDGGGGPGMAVHVTVRVRQPLGPPCREPLARRDVGRELPAGFPARATHGPRSGEDAGLAPKATRTILSQP